MDFTLNGRAVSVEATPGQSLLGVLREGCGLRSMKDGCAPEGSCGACTVIVDGHAVVSCARPAERAEGRIVETLEGLPDGVRRAWADAFVATGASQCGYCSPGIVMKAEALLRRDPAPAREIVAKSLAGNLCRCTGYASIIEAIELVAAVRRGEAREAGSPADAADADAVAEGPTDPFARYEGRELALGDKPFIGDLVAPGMLHGALRFAGVPRAVVRRIDTARAAAVPGVVAVLTAADVPGRREQGLIVPDWPLLVAEGETVRYVGDILAAVAAETREAAVEAAALVDVELEPLPAVTDPFEALADGAPPIHAGGNVVHASVIRRGDAEAALAGAAHVASGSFRTQAIEHAFLEPEAALAVPRGAAGPDGTPVADHVVHVYSPGQGAWEDRRQVASFLGLEPAEVLVTQVSTGGAFGGKEDLSVQAQAALLAVRDWTPRAAPPQPPREHPLPREAPPDVAGLHGRLRRGGPARRRPGADHRRQRRLRERRGQGPGARRGPRVRAVPRPERGRGGDRGLHEQPAVGRHARVRGQPGRVRARGRAGHAGRAGRRGRLGVPLAQRARRRRPVHDRPEAGRGRGRPGDAARGEGRVSRAPATRGSRAASRTSASATGCPSGAGPSCAPRPTAPSRCSTPGRRWGRGAHTVFRQLAASELGIPVDRVRVVVDTSHELDTGETTSSRATMLGGRAVQRARAALTTALGDRGAAGLADLAGREFAGEYLVDWTTKLEAAVEEPVTHFAYGWATQVVILDDEGRIERVVAAHDVGHALNPILLKGQVEGGVHMGLGMALTEAFRVEDGVPVTDTLKSLGIIPAAAMPPVETILVEVPQPEGPLGAKGMGEAVLVPTAAAVAGALHAYDGIRRTRLPMSDSPAARALLPRLAREAAGRGPSS